MKVYHSGGCIVYHQPIFLSQEFYTLFRLAWGTIWFGKNPHHYILQIPTSILGSDFEVGQRHWGIPYAMSPSMVAYHHGVNANPFHHAFYHLRCECAWAWIYQFLGTDGDDSRPSSAIYFRSVSIRHMRFFTQVVIQRKQNQMNWAIKWEWMGTQSERARLAFTLCFSILWWIRPRIYRIDVFTW